MAWYAMRRVIARVLPVPAPARTHTGPTGASTTSRCSGSSPSSAAAAEPFTGGSNVESSGAALTLATLAVRADRKLPGPAIVDDQEAHSAIGDLTRAKLVVVCTS